MQFVSNFELNVFIATRFFLLFALVEQILHEVRFSIIRRNWYWKTIDFQNAGSVNSLSHDLNSNKAYLLENVLIVLVGVVKNQSDDSSLNVNMNSFQFSWGRMLIVIRVEAEVAQAKEAVWII